MNMFKVHLSSLKNIGNEISLHKASLQTYYGNALIS